MTISIPRAPVDPSWPRLRWPGRPEGPLELDPAPLPTRERWGEGPVGRLALGDNLGALAALAPGSARLAYLDPPFFSEARYLFRTQADGHPFTLPAFGDRWADLGAYLSHLEDRLRLVARALAPDGSLYLHLDAHAAHYAKALLDEIFGPEAFSRQIVWRVGWVSGFKSRARNWIRNHDLLLYYARPGAPFHRQLLPHPPGYSRRGGGEGAGRPLEDVWTDLDSIQLKSFSGEKTGWATQKNEALLGRVIRASSDPGDLVIDPYAGAGTTAVVAARLGRRFFAADTSPLALHLGRRRLWAEGAAFEGVGEAPEVAGPLKLRREGLRLHLEGAPASAGPDEVSPLGRLDAWWIEAEGRCLCASPRPLGRRPGRVPEALTLPPDLGPARAVAVDLAGRRHEGPIPT